MLPILPSVLEEIHKLHRESFMVCLLAVRQANIFIARNVRDVVWRNTTWERSWFEIEGIVQSGDEYAPSVNVHFSNIGGLAEQRVRDHNMLRKMWAELYIVNSNFLDIDDYILYVKLQIKKPVFTRQIVTISAGLDNPLTMPFPFWKLHDSICQYPIFPGDPRCPYVGDIETCNRTIMNCINRHGHGKYFGAQLGMINAVQDEEDL
jgi:hypothetical protein